MAIAVTSITPVSGLGSGTVSITDLAGSDFVAVSIVSLKRAGYDDIVATNIVTVSGIKVTCDFDLTGLDRGVYDVYVENADTSNDTLVGGFEILQPPPVVVFTNPSSVIEGSGATYIEIHGEYLENAASVKLKKTGESDIECDPAIYKMGWGVSVLFDFTGAVAGSWDVYLVLDDAQDDTLSDGFSIAPLVGGGAYGGLFTTDALGVFNVAGEKLQGEYLEKVVYDYISGGATGAIFTLSCLDSQGVSHVLLNSGAGGLGTADKVFYPRVASNLNSSGGVLGSVQAQKSFINGQLVFSMTSGGNRLPYNFYVYTSKKTRRRQIR